MRLAKVQLARAIWLFDTAELNPLGVNFFRNGIAYRLASKYQFKQYPVSEEHVSGSKSLRFDTGSYFHAPDATFYDVGLEIFSDGVTADSRNSTEICDFFLDEVVRWIAGELKVDLPPTVGKKRAYKSELVIYADSNLTGFSPVLDMISASLGHLVGEQTEPTAISIGSDGKHSLFSFERRANEPFEDLKYFSSAILKTSDHIDLLNRFAFQIQNWRDEMARPQIENAPQGSLPAPEQGD